MGMTIIEERPEVKTADPGDHDKFKHYVFTKDLDESVLNGGSPVRAVCGKVWTPSLDYDRFPTCPECHEFYKKTRDE